MADSEIGTGSGGGMGSEDLQSHEGSARGFGATGGLTKRISVEESGKCNRIEGGGRELIADVLQEVLSYLPQKELFEIMLVSRVWHKAIVDGSLLWRILEVASTWDSGGMGVEGMEGVEEVEGNERLQGRKGRVPDVLSQVLRVAEVVRFKSSIPDGQDEMMVVGGINVIYQNFQETYTRSITPSFFPALLADCPNLKSLALDGMLAVDGTSVHICHPGLERIKLPGWNHFALTLDCPSLLDLSFGLDARKHLDLDEIRARAPSLNCPRLTDLQLSDCYSSEGVLESMAAHAPGIKRLKVNVNLLTPFQSVLKFGAIRELSLVAHNAGIHADSFAQLPNLEKLELEGHEVTKDLKLALRRLRSLILTEYDDVVAIDLNCPLLDYFKIKSHNFVKGWDRECECPWLKKMHVVCDFFGLEDLEEDGDLEIHSEVVQKLVLQNLVRQDVVIGCKKLETLVISWLPLMVAPLRLPRTDAPNLKSLELDGYPCMLPIIPYLLSTLPVLKVLKICCCLEFMKELELEHASICDLVVANSKAEMDFDGGIIKRDVFVEEFDLIVMMPSLLQVDVRESNVGLLKVFATGKPIFITTRYGCAKRKGDDYVQ